MFTVANEDNNCYTFDMRNMKTYTLKHTDHFNAVIDIPNRKENIRKKDKKENRKEKNTNYIWWLTNIDYSPSGTEFVTGSYDRHIRIFPLEFVEYAKSREVYLLIIIIYFYNLRIIVYFIWLGKVPHNSHE